MSPDVVVLGAGIVGCASAYYLAKAGASVTLVERDSVASHASGMALGGLLPLSGIGIPGPLAPLSLESFGLIQGLAPALWEETGVDPEFRLCPAVTVAFSEEEASHLRARLPWQQAQEGFRVEWQGGEALRATEPRLSPRALGGLVTHSVGLLDPYRMTLALLQAAERAGAKVRHGEAQGLRFRGGQVRGVVVKGQVVACQGVVIAMGPWSGVASRWLGLELPVEPLKGEIVRLRVDGPPVPYISWGHTYAVSKPDGLLWVGTTEEQAGFDDGPSPAARRAILANALEGLPFLMNAQVVRQTACLRPVTRDGLPLLGVVPGKGGVVVATGAGRKGILLGPLMGRIAAELVVERHTSYDLSPLAPGRAMPKTVQETDPLRF